MPSIKICVTLSFMYLRDCAPLGAVFVGTVIAGCVVAGGGAGPPFRCGVVVRAGIGMAPLETAAMETVGYDPGQHE